MRIGVIGMGSIGSRHAANLTALGHKVLAYDMFMDNPHGNKCSLEQVLEQADAFVIATPIDTHYWYVNACSDKPTFVEKPITDQIDDVLTTTNVKMVGYNLRFHSCVLKAKGWIEGGFLGAALWANFVCGQKNRKYKEHVILNWSHEIDLALYLLGPAIVVGCGAVDSIADLILQHNRNLLTTIHLDYVTEPEIRQFIIAGNKATIIVDLKARYAWLRDASGTMLEHFEGDDTWDDNYLDEMETFIARCDGMATAGATAEDGLAVAQICLDAIERSKK